MFVFYAGDCPLAAVASALPDSGERVRVAQQEPARDLSAATHVLALEYTCPLDAMGLAEGFLPLAGIGAGRALGAPARVLRAELEGGALSAWTELTPAPALEVRVDLPPPEVCLPFEVETFRLPGVAPGDSASFLVDAGGGRILAGTIVGLYFVVDRSGVVEERQLPFPARLGGWAAPSGELWLAGDGGDFVRGTLDTGFAPAPSLERGAEHLVVLAGPDTPSVPFELYAVTGSGTLEHFDGRTWHALHADVMVPRAGVAWIGSGHAIASGIAGGQLVRHRAGMIDLENPDGAVDETTAVAFVPGIGAVAGSGIGGLHLDAGDGRWTSVGGESVAIRQIIPRPRSFLYGGRFGVFSEWIAGEGSCPPVNYAADDVQQVATLRDGSIALIARPRGGDLELSILTRPREPCL